MLDRRLSVDADVFHTQSKNGYFFVYIAADSTQNASRKQLKSPYVQKPMSTIARSWESGLNVAG